MAEADPEVVSVMSDSKSEMRSADRLVRARSVTRMILVILASLGVVVSLVGGWVRTTLLDTDSFMEVVEPSLASDEVSTVLGEAISDQVVIALDLEGRLATRLSDIDAYLTETLIEALDLPSATKLLLARSDLPRLANLAGAIAEPIEGQIDDAVHALVASEAFQERLPDAIAFAHTGAVALIRQDEENLDNVSIVDGEVRWNIVPIVGEAIRHVIDGGLLNGVLEPLQLSGATYEGRRDDAIASLGEALATVLPDDFGQITVMSEERLEGWQSIARTLDRIAVLAIVVTLALVGAALWISRDRRRVLVQFAAGSVVALVVTGIVQRNVLDSLDKAIPGPSEQAAVEVLFDAVFANLRVTSWIFIAVAVAVGLSAHVAGQPKWIKALQHRQTSDSAGLLHRLDTAIAHHRDAFIAGGVGAALLAWWWLGINLASLLIVGAVLGAYMWYLTRATTQDGLADTTSP